MKKLIIIFLVLLMATNVAAQSITNTAKRKTTIVVAASDSNASIRTTADYVCDGTADEVQFNAAFASLPATGGEVLAVAGSYSLTGEIAFTDDDITLRFAAGNSVTVDSGHDLQSDSRIGYAAQNTSAAIVAVGRDNVRVEGIYLDMNAPTGQANGYTSDQHWAGIWFDTCTNSTIENSHVEDMFYDIVITTYRAFGILFLDCSDSQMRRCNTDGAGYEGMGMRGNCLRCKVVDGTGSGNKTHLVQGAKSGTDGPQDCVIDGVIGGGSVIFHGETSGGLQDCTISNCIVSKVKVSGDINNIIVSNNTSGNFELFGGASDTMINVSLTGNMIINNADTGGDSPLEINSVANSSAIQSISVTGNHIIGGRVWIHDGGGTTGSTMDNISFDGNTWYSPTGQQHGFYINNSGTGGWTNFTISDNDMVLDQISSTTHAIWVRQESTGDITNFNVKNNTVSSYNLIRHDGGTTANFSDITISGNTLDLNDTVNTEGSILAFEDNVSNIIIQDNTIINCDYMLNSMTAGGDVTDLWILDNYVKSMDGGSGVWFEPGDGDGTVDDVRIDGNYGDDAPLDIATPVSYWNFNAGLLDLTNNGFTLTTEAAHNAPDISSGDYAAFVRTNNEAFATGWSPSTIVGQDGFTVNLWFYFDTLTTNDKVFATTTSNPDRFYLGLNNTVADDLLVGLGDTSMTTATDWVLADTWYMLTVVHDRRIAGSSDDFFLYVDGNLLLQDEVTAMTYEQTTDITLGGATGITTTDVDGRMDDLRFYSRPLSAAEIAGLYSAR